MCWDSENGRTPLRTPSEDIESNLCSVTERSEHKEEGVSDNKEKIEIIKKNIISKEDLDINRRNIDLLGSESSIGGSYNRILDNYLYLESSVLGIGTDRGCPSEVRTPLSELRSRRDIVCGGGEEPREENESGVEVSGDISTRARSLPPIGISNTPHIIHIHNIEKNIQTPEELGVRDIKENCSFTLGVGKMNELIAGHEKSTSDLHLRSPPGFSVGVEQKPKQVIPKAYTRDTESSRRKFVSGTSNTTSNTTPNTTPTPSTEPVKLRVVKKLNSNRDIRNRSGKKRSTSAGKEKMFKFGRAKDKKVGEDKRKVIEITKPNIENINLINITPNATETVKVKMNASSYIQNKYNNLTKNMQKDQGEIQTMENSFNMPSSPPPQVQISTIQPTQRPLQQAKNFFSSLNLN